MLQGYDQKICITTIPKKQLEIANDNVAHIIATKNDVKNGIKVEYGDGHE